MKAKEWKRFCQPVMPEGWAVRGSLCYRKPTGRILYGVLGDNSAHGNGAYVWHVVVPLFEPVEGGIDLGHSKRIGFWEQTEPEALTDAIVRGFTDLPSEETLLREWADLGLDLNTRVQEVAACSLVLLGDVEGAQAVIADVAAKEGGDNRDWVLETEQRVAHLGKILTDEGLDAAVAHLDTVVRQSINELKLDAG